MPIDYGRLVSRTWEIFSRNRVLWILGLIAALASGSTSSLNFNQSTGSSSSGDLPNFAPFWEQWGGLVIGLGCGLIILAIVLSFVNAAAEAGMIATVDHIERTGEQPTFGAAWGMGTRKMLSLWLLNLVIGLIIFVIVLILIVPVIVLFAGTIAAAVGSGGDDAAAGAFLLACLCICGLVLVLIPLLIALNLIQLLAQRAVVLENQGVFEAIGTGRTILSANRGPTLVAWLIALVVGFIEGFAGLIVLLPVSLIFILPAMGVLMDPTNITFDDFPWPLLLIGIVVLWVLTGLIGALFRALTSTLWTVYYRNRRQMPNSDLTPAGMLPPVGPGGSSYGSPYGPAPGSPYGAPPPAYPPAQGAPPSYTPPPYTPPPATPGSPYSTPQDTTNMGYTPPPTGGVQYGSPYSSPTTPMPPLGTPPSGPADAPPSPPPDDRARGPEGGGGSA